ncbi:MAG: two-component system nitrogen regulation sensor histidine kinase NtrY, partial [Algoriphagus sp.]
MNHEIRRLVILISVFSLLVVLILNFFFLQKSDQESYLKDLQDRIQAVDREFDEDFIQILMDVRNEDTLSFLKISNPIHKHPFFILNPSGELLFWSDFSLTLDFTSIDLNKDYQLIEGTYGTLLLKSRTIRRNNAEFRMVHAIRLVWPGTIENDYLITGANLELFGNNKFEVFSPEGNLGQLVTNPAGIKLFRVSFLMGYAPAGRVINSALLIFFTSVFLLYFIFSSNFVLKKWRMGRRWKAIGYAISM